MKNTEKAEKRVLYNAPELEIIRLQDSDVITASGATDGFWGEEDDFGGMYSEYEW